MRHTTPSPRAAGLLVAAALLLAAADARADVVCTLLKPAKQMVKGKWMQLERGDNVVVKSRGTTWSRVESAAGLGRIKTAVLEGACPAITKMPLEEEKPADAAKPADPPVEPLPTPPPVEPVVAPVVEPAATPATPTPAEATPPAPPAEPAAPAPPAVVADKLVAVTDLKAPKEVEGIADALATMIVAELAARDGFRAVSRSELKSILSHKADAALLGCDSVGCLGDVGKLVDAQLVVTGSLERAGDAYVLAISLVDPAGPTILEREEAAWRGKPDGMLALVRPLVDRLLAGPDAATHTGGIDIVGMDGARVVVDGKEIGTAPLKGPITGLPTGVHRVQLEKDGFLPHDGEVVVARNESTIVRVTLEEIPFTQQAWFWLATGGSALLAAGTTVGIVTWAALSTETPTRVVLAPKP